MIGRLKTWVINIPWVWRTFQDFVGADPWKHAIYPSVIRTKGKLLDFGCSMGNSTEAFLDFDYWGADVDPAAIAAARDRWRNRDNVRFEVVDILGETYRKDFFDHVIIACTGHHIADTDLPKIIDKLLETMKPGGELHFFDVIRQPGRDRLVTRLFLKSDQGKHMRTRDAYRTMFAPYVVVEERLFESPDQFLKLPDLIYFRVATERDADAHGPLPS